MILKLIDLEKIRQETPTVRHEINLNNATGSAMPTPVVDDMVHFIKGSIELRGDPHFQEWSRTKNTAVKPNIAKLINAKPTEIVLTKNATEGINLVANSLPFKKGDNVVISNLEFHSNVTPWLRLRDQKGIEVRIAKSGKDLVLDPAAVEGLVDENTKLVSIVHVPNSVGTVQPAREIGRAAKQKNALFLLNASMSVGVTPVDVKAIGCDFLVTPGRKWLRGPSGSGFLYVREEVANELTPPFIGYVATYWLKNEESYEYKPGGARFEVGNQGSVNNLGLGSAVEYALKIGIEEIEARVRKLFSQAYEGLRSVEEVETYGTSDLSKRVFFVMNIKGANASIVTALLRNERIHMEAGDYITLMIPDIIGIDDWLRVSPHYFNSEQEMDAFVNSVKNITRRYRGTMVPKRLGYAALEKDAVR